MRQPIFIFAPLGRSGTNYLANLLALHPDCGPAQPPYLEDWFLAHAGLLVEYAQRTASRYRERNYDGYESAETNVAEALGRGLAQLLGTDRRVITKTPSLEGVEHFSRLFPEVTPIVLLRDGRNVAVSFKRSFGGEIQEIAKWWRRGARRYLELKESGLALHEVRYESILQSTEQEMIALLDALQLDRSTYPFAESLALPVVGSSTFGAVNGKVSWEPVPRTDEFDPLRRFASLSDSELQQFGEIAGAEQIELGYPLGRD